MEIALSKEGNNIANELDFGVMMDSELVVNYGSFISAVYNRRSAIGNVAFKFWVITRISHMPEAVGPIVLVSGIKNQISQQKNCFASGICLTERSFFGDRIQNLNLSDRELTDFDRKCFN